MGKPLQSFTVSQVTGIQTIEKRELRGVSRYAGYCHWVTDSPIQQSTAGISGGSFYGISPSFGDPSVLEEKKKLKSWPRIPP